MNTLTIILAIVTSSIFATPVLVISVILACFSLYIIFQRRKYAHIPGPKFRNFFLGNIEEVLQYKMNRHLLWVTWAKEHGPLFKMCFFHKVFLVANSPEMIREFCLNRRYSKARFEYGQLGHLCGARFMGKSLLTETDHALWRSKRLALNPAFHKNYLKETIRAFNVAGDRLVAKLMTMSDGKQSIPLLDYVGRATLDTLCDVAFSMDINCLEDDKSPFPLAVYTSLKMMTECFRDPFINLKPWRWNEIRSGVESAKFLRATGRDLIRKRIEQHEKGEETPQDILDIMVQHSHDAVGEEQLIDEFITLFIAGQETTANSLAFLFSLLGRHPKVMRRVREEIDSQLADKAFIEFEDLEGLRITEASWREGLRLYPPAYATIRETPASGCEVGGIRLPGETSVIVNFLGVHYLYNERGYDFWPDRYLGGREDPYTFLSFSAGQRSCIGRHFANFEAKVFISKLIQSFDFELDNEQCFDVDEALTLRLLDGAKFRLTRRTLDNN